MTRNQVLVCNCGSSSVKVDVFACSTDGETLLASATAERVGTEETQIRIKVPAEQIIEPGNVDHAASLETIARELLGLGIFTESERLGVGHRIVHGGHYIKTPVIVTGEVISIIEQCSELAPLHNPANLSGVRAATDLFGGQHVAVFDTAFHATMEAAAFTYGLPRALAEKHHLRRYGFHGPSHEYVGREAAAHLGRSWNSLRLITLHLGNGASACAIQNGKSVETSMGFTPLEGLLMGTRSGDLDPAALTFLLQREPIEVRELDRILNRESGLKGICGHNDMRDLLARAGEGDEACALARDVFCRRIKKYVGAYYALLGGADAIVFTAGIGENSHEVRERSLAGLEELGISVEESRNESIAPGKVGPTTISPASARVSVLVVPTDEELMIARETARLLRG